MKLGTDERKNGAPMFITHDVEPRFQGRAVSLPTVQQFVEALTAFTRGEEHPLPLYVSYSEVDGDILQAETYELSLITTLEFDPFSEHMNVIGLDAEFRYFCLSLRRNGATSNEISDYIEIY